MAKPMSEIERLTARPLPQITRISVLKRRTDRAARRENRSF